jgi:hypothetical protein
LLDLRGEFIEQGGAACRDRDMRHSVAVHPFSRDRLDRRKSEQAAAKAVKRRWIKQLSGG